MEYHNQTNSSNVIMWNGSSLSPILEEGFGFELGGMGLKVRVSKDGNAPKLKVCEAAGN